MFGCVGGGFSSRCKSRIKLTRSRIIDIKRRRSATVGYLKNDMAELLKNGLDINAFGRAEGLISEMNRLYCYELIEQFCGCILEKLKSMRKLRECPPESKEAVSSLMFAAARFADLPELRDLRDIFTDRYGNALGTAINHEFAEKVESGRPSMDQKIQLLRNISREFSINWDSKAFGERISNPITPDRAEKCESLRKVKDGAVANIDKDDAVIKTEVPSYERRELTPTRYEVKAENSKIIHPITITGHDRPSFGPNKSGHKGSAVNIPPLGPNKSDHRGSAENVKQHYISNAIPPYTKTKGSKYGTDLEVYHAGSDYSERTDLSIVAGNIAINEKTKVGKNHDFHEMQLVGPVARSKGSGDENNCNQDYSVIEAQHKLRSVRRKKHTKVLVPENYTTTEDNERVSRNPNGRRSQGIRCRPNFDDDHDEEDMIMDELLIHYSKKSPTYKSSRAPKGPKAPDRYPDASKSSLPRNKEASESGLPPTRVASLPPQRKAPTEVQKAPVRAASLEPNMLRPHVHPKLPEYDDLPARIAALRGERY